MRNCGGVTMEKPEIERRFIKADAGEFRAEKRDDGVTTLSGYAAVFDTLSDDLGGFREKIAPKAFANALGKSDVRALFNHNPDMVLGRLAAGTLRLKEDDRGLWMEVDLPDTQIARDLAVSVNRGDISQQSFAFYIKTDQWEEDRDKKTMTRTIVEVDELFDVSPVTYPAYPDTDVAQRSLAKHKSTVIGGGSSGVIAKRQSEDLKRENYLKSKGHLTCLL